MSTFDTFANDSLVTVPAASLAVAKAACYRTARVAVAQDWPPGELREVLAALGLIDTPQPFAAVPWSAYPGWGGFSSRSHAHVALAESIAEVAQHDGNGGVAAVACRLHIVPTLVALGPQGRGGKASEPVRRES